MCILSVYVYASSSWWNEALPPCCGGNMTLHWVTLDTSVCLSVCPSVVYSIGSWPSVSTLDRFSVISILYRPQPGQSLQLVCLWLTVHPTPVINDDAALMAYCEIAREMVNQERFLLAASASDSDAANFSFFHYLLPFPVNDVKEISWRQKETETFWFLRRHDISGFDVI